MVKWGGREKSLHPPRDLHSELAYARQQGKEKEGGGTRDREKVKVKVKEEKGRKKEKWSRELPRSDLPPSKAGTD